MAKKIIEGLWDCPYCGQKGIGGLTKSCPNCAHPQDADTKFYLGEKKEYLDAEKAKDYGKGADWTCAFCGSLNRFGNANCVNCGAQREDSSGDYFENRRREEAARPQPQPRPQKPKRKLWPLLIAVLAVIAVIFFVTRPRDRTTTVTDKTWQRAIDVETYATVREEGWSVPEGGRLVSGRRAIRSYEQVLDHYEEEAYQVAYEVEDGYDIEVDYEDNGDGTFTEVEYEVPRYRTEYRTEYRTVPVYRQEPVYDTLYEYDIDKWVPSRTEEAGGSCYEPRSAEVRAGGWRVEAEPYWPDTRLGGSERESARREEYVLYFTDAREKSYSARVPEELWNRFRRDDSVELEVQGSRVLAVNGVRISG